jgi:hypothetical protein
MISRNALYNFLESVIETATAAEDDSPLKGAVSFRSLRGSVDEAKKVVRVDCYSGRVAKTDETRCRETDVDFVIEFYVTPDEATGELSALELQDAAVDLSFEMLYEAFDKLTDSAGVTLNGNVDHLNTGEFDTGTANLGTISRGASYLYGKINP